MVVSKLQGGLGNQLFEYATGRAIAHNRKESDFFIDINAYNNDKLRDYELRYYDIVAAIASSKDIDRLIIINKILSRICNVLKIKCCSYLGVEQKSHAYQNLSKAFYLEGYFQHIDYFDSVKSLLMMDFILNIDCFKEEEKAHYNRWSAMIESVNAVAIHIRRTDYLQSSNTYWLLNEEYYINSIKHINDNVDVPVFFVFPDDIEWCRQQEFMKNIDNVFSC